MCVKYLRNEFFLAIFQSRSVRILFWKLRSTQLTISYDRYFPYILCQRGFSSPNIKQIDIWNYFCIRTSFPVTLGSNSSKTNTFTRKKKSCNWDLNTGSLVPKSAMLAPRPQINEKCLKNQKNFGYIFSNSKFFKFLVMNYETHSSQMCRRLEIILS